MKCEEEGGPLLILAGKECGSGSSRDWAAKGVLLLGVRAKIAARFEHQCCVSPRRGLVASHRGAQPPEHSTPSDELARALHPAYPASILVCVRTPHMDLAAAFVDHPQSHDP